MIFIETDNFSRGSDKDAGSKKMISQCEPISVQYLRKKFEKLFLATATVAQEISLLTKIQAP